MESFNLKASDGMDVACYSWVPDSPIGAIHIAHGMGEHAKRYEWVASKLNEKGYAVYANDHRGHGETGRGSLGYMGGDGWNRVLADAFEINQLIRSRHTGLPLVLLGHSMGSMMSQQYITRYGASIDALVLSGSPGFKSQVASIIPKLLVKFEHWRLQPDQMSTLMQGLLFGGANKPFEGPGASGFEWLSRDPEQVQLYVDDEFCGFVLSIGSLQNLYAGSANSQDKTCIAKIPRALPMYIFSGEQDPVHGERKDIERMVAEYRRHGIHKLDYKLYPGGRHEMFNEVNKDEVMSDLLAWLDKSVGRDTGAE